MKVNSFWIIDVLTFDLLGKKIILFLSRELSMTLKHINATIFYPIFHRNGPPYCRLVKTRKASSNISLQCFLNYWVSIAGIIPNSKSYASINHIFIGQNSIMILQRSVYAKGRLGTSYQKHLQKDLAFFLFCYPGKTCQWRQAHSHWSISHD